MNALLDLDELIVAKIAGVSEHPAGLEDLLGCLVAGAGLVIAMAADGDTLTANDLCERVSINIFEAAASQARLVDMARGRA